MALASDQVKCITGFLDCGSAPVVTELHALAFYLAASEGSSRLSCARRDKEESIYVGVQRIPVLEKFVRTCLEIQAEWASLHTKSIRTC